MIMKEHIVLQEHTMKEKNLWESSSYFLCLSFLLNLDPQRQSYTFLTLPLILVNLILLSLTLITDSVQICLIKKLTQQNIQPF